MKLIIFAAIIIFSVQPIETKNAKRTAKSEVTPHANQSEISCDKTNNSQCSPVSVVINNAPTPNNQADEDRFNKSMETQRRIAFYTGLLVLVGLATGIFVGWQAWETRKAAKAAKTNAEIARINTEFLIRGERSLITTERPQEPHLLPAASALLGEELLAHVFIFIKNSGRTPATIIAEKFELQVGDNPNMPPNDSIYGMAPNTQNIAPYVIPAQEIPIPKEADYVNGFLTGQEFNAVQGKVKYVWLCGIVRYHDVYQGASNEHETTVCLMWETRTNAPNPFWRISGLPAYNHTT